MGAEMRTPRRIAPCKRLRKEPVSAPQIPTGTPSHFVPTSPRGLTDEQAAQRKKNVTRADPGKSAWQVVAGNLFTAFNLLNAVLALCLALVGSWRNMLFLGVVVSNTLIGTVQELRARRTIRRLTLLNAPAAHVLRCGEERRCRPEDLAEGDLIRLRAGDQVLADALVSEGCGAANEALLTGESDPVRKQPGDWLMSGSYIVEGTFTAQLVRVGDDSYAAQLTQSARAIKRPRSALMTELNRLIRYVSAVLVPLGALLFVKQYFILHAPLELAVPSSVAAMLGMIPEGLMLLTSVAMAVGVVRLGRRNTLVQELYGIETLARADVLCLDKTGTLTTGGMRLDHLVPLSATEEEMRAEISRYLGAVGEESATLSALRQDIDPENETPLRVLPFSSARKKSAVSFADGTTLVLGAPTFVTGGQLPQAVANAVRQAAEQGRRVLLLARCRGCVMETDTPPVEALLGLCVLADEVRPRAAETLDYFRRQGVTLKIISGDDPRTVAALGKRVGLEGPWVDASTLSDEQLEEACERYAIFGRVTPAQKERLVMALKRRGHSVAMTGDGVNDIPALKAADCSIAVAGGSDAAKNASQLTLLDADFANLPLVVAEGRRVVGNITRAASLFLVKTLYSFALALLLLPLPAAYPFQPIQLTLVSSLTIGLPSFFLALEPHEGPIPGHFLRTVLTRAIPGAAAVTVCACASMLLARLGWQGEVCSTLATLSAGAMGVLMLLRVCLPLTKTRLAVLCGVCVLLVGAVLLLGEVFFLIPLTWTQLGILGLLILLGGGVMAALAALLRKKNEKETHAT